MCSLQRRAVGPISTFRRAQARRPETRTLERVRRVPRVPGFHGLAFHGSSDGSAELGFHGFGRASAPFGFAAEAVDAELLEELEMGAELIGGHDQREASLAGARPEQLLDAVEDDAGDAGLALERDRLLARPSPMIVTALVSASKPWSGCETSLATIRSTFLRARLSRALATTSWVSAANPTSTGRVAAETGAHGAEVGKDVLRPLQRERHRRVRLGDFCVGRRRRRVVGDRGGHDDHVRIRRRHASPPRASRRRCARAIISSTAGGSTVVGPATSVTRRRAGGLPRRAQSPCGRSSGCRHSARDRCLRRSGRR